MTAEASILVTDRASFEGVECRQTPMKSHEEKETPSRESGINTLHTTLLHKRETFAMHLLASLAPPLENAMENNSKRTKKEKGQEYGGRKENCKGRQICAREKNRKLNEQEREQGDKPLTSNGKQARRNIRSRVHRSMAEGKIFAPQE